eukprot:jgi/Botrbrau1/6078/Bobra.177_1s0017.1
MVLPSLDARVPPAVSGGPSGIGPPPKPLAVEVVDISKHSSRGRAQREGSPEVTSPAPKSSSGACDTHFKAFKGAYKLAEAHANAAGDTKPASRCNRIMNRIQECRNSNELLAGKKLDLNTVTSLLMSQAVPLLEEHFEMDNTMENMKGAKMKEVMNDVWSSIPNGMEQGREKEMTLDEAYQRWWQKAKSNIQKALGDESKALGKLPGASGHVTTRLFPGGRDVYARAPPQKMPRMQGSLAPAQKKMEFEGGNLLAGGQVVPWTSIRGESDSSWPRKCAPICYMAQGRPRRAELREG